METYREVEKRFKLGEKVTAKGKEMRQYQKTYFKTRKKSALFAAKKAEQEFDTLITSYELLMTNNQ